MWAILGGVDRVSGGHPLARLWHAGIGALWPLRRQQVWSSTVRRFLHSFALR